MSDEDLVELMCAEIGMNHAKYGNDPPGLWDAAIRAVKRARIGERLRCAAIARDYSISFTGAEMAVSETKLGIAAAIAQDE